MQAFNIAVGVSNIVNCVTGVCTLGAYRKNETCKIKVHLNASDDYLLIAFDDLAKYAQDLDLNEYQELEKDCNELDDTLRAKIAAVKVAKLNYFVKTKKYGELLEDVQTLEEKTRQMIEKIRGKSAAARAQEAERKRMAQHEGSNHDVVQAAQSVGNRGMIPERCFGLGGDDFPLDSNQQNPFSDEATTAWQSHGHSA